MSAPGKKMNFAVRLCSPSFCHFTHRGACPLFFCRVVFLTNRDCMRYDSLMFPQETFDRVYDVLASECCAAIHIRKCPRKTQPPPRPWNGSVRLFLPLSSDPLPLLMMVAPPSGDQPMAALKVALMVRCHACCAQHCTLCGQSKYFGYRRNALLFCLRCPFRVCVCVYLIRMVHARVSEARRRADRDQPRSERPASDRFGGGAGGFDRERPASDRFGGGGGGFDRERPASDRFGGGFDRERPASDRFGGGFDRDRPAPRFGSGFDRDDRADRERPPSDRFGSRGDAESYVMSDTHEFSHLSSRATAHVLLFCWYFDCVCVCVCVCMLMWCKLIQWTSTCGPYADRQLCAAARVPISTTPWRGPIGTSCLLVHKFRALARAILLLPLCHVRLCGK
jgi:hypothetical protein